MNSEHMGFSTETEQILVNIRLIEDVSISFFTYVKI